MTLSQHSWTSAYQKVQDIIPSSISREVAIDSLEVKTSLDNVSQKVQMLLEEPCIWDFYNIFFQNSQKFFWFDGVYDLKDYFLDLLSNDIEKAVYFMKESIQYFLDKLVLLQFDRKTPFSIKDIQSSIWKLKMLNDDIDAFYDFEEKNKVNNFQFTKLVTNWEFDTAFNFVIAIIKREKEVLEEVRTKIYRKTVSIEPEKLPSLKKWKNQLERLRSETRYLPLNINF